MKCKAKAATKSPPSSSMDSCGVAEPPAAISTASSRYRPPPISTDLHLGLSRQACSSSTHTAHNSSPSTPRSALTTTTATDIPAYESGGGGQGQQSLFVKVYMEGVPIGRKLDLLLLDGYDGLLALLARMFKASIIHHDIVGGDHQGETQGRHVLTYQDHEGDWLMAGDVPWELFLASVKKLRIACADSCFH
ncbi:hypothetical protein QYE76_009386 [Lolium multiflorum]|uniref:Auxin-responsive protein n=1 Tax=Lolium multiflorum TaxID=4521 RepID=A0AAD8X3I4_LOLMU|nr:hypothetical protein QYE76_009386 [Lolium multiflorum]